MALARGPFWALLSCAVVYFNSPQEDINWWAGYLPFTRWSLLSSAILIISYLLHKDKIAKIKKGSFIWSVCFCILTAMITVYSSVNVPDSNRFLFQLISYTIICFCIIKGIITTQQFKYFILVIILFASSLSFKAYVYGERINARLENIGINDSFGSNQFALLIASIVPFAIPFILKGNWWQRLFCLSTFPLIVNAFVLCNSRGAFVAAALSFFISVCFFADLKLKKIMVFSFIIFIPLFVYLSDEYLIDRLATLLEAESAMQSESQAIELSSGRVEIWGYGFQMVKDHPFGAGPNAFKSLARLYMPAEVLTYHNGSDIGIRGAHNTYLQVLVEQGVLGLFIWLCMCGHTCYIMFACVRNIKRNRYDNLFWKSMVFSLSLSYFTSIFGGLFSSRVYYEFFWWQMAFVIVGVSLVNKEILRVSDK